jgi:hypothetical protein
MRKSRKADRVDTKQIIMNKFSKLTKFLIVTAAVVILESLYFEFVFSRDFDFFGSTILTIASAILGFWYIMYASDFAMEVLKLKNKPENTTQETNGENTNQTNQ